MAETRDIEVGIGLGSNLGNRLGMLIEARERIEAIPGLRLVAVSPVYETRPVDVAPAHRKMWFLNAVLVARWSGDVRDLAAALRRIETDMGRRRGPERNTPRSIDIDLLYAGDMVIREDELEVPHPRWAGRRFVVQPLADVRPETRLPGQSRTVKEVLAELPDAVGVRRFATRW